METSEFISHTLLSGFTGGTSGAAMELEEEVFRFNQTRSDNSSLSDVDFTLDGTIDGAYDNFSYLYCTVNNFTYLNITCEPTFDFSLPLLGKLLQYF